MSDLRILTGPEVSTHNSRDSCWIIVHGTFDAHDASLSGTHSSLGKVYDVTDFLDGEFLCCLHILYID